MLVCDDVLFIHVPKTGGMSATRFLIDNVPGKKLLTAPDGNATPRGGRRVATGCARGPRDRVTGARRDRPRP